jgi:hypothetical protein
VDGLHGALTEAIRAHVEDALAAETDPESAETSSVLDDQHDRERAGDQLPVEKRVISGLSSFIGTLPGMSG